MADASWTSASTSSNSGHLFWNLKDPVSVLVQTPLHRRKITHHPLAFFINWFQCRIFNIFKCSLTAASTLSSCTSELSPTNDKDAELNWQSPFSIDLNKTLSVRTNEGRKAWHTFFTTYISKRSKAKACTVWQYIMLLVINECFQRN